MEELNLEGFTNWYTMKRIRSTGKPPSPVTLRNKAVQLRSAQARVFSGSLCAVLSDRKAWSQLQARLLSEMTTGSCRNVTYALRDYGTYLTELGEIDHCVIENADIPPTNPPPAITVYSEQEMELLCSAAWGRSIRWGCFINFLAITGRRVGEALSLEWPWFRLGETPPYVELPMTKNGNPQYIPFNDRLMEVFSPDHIAHLKMGLSENGQDYSRDGHLHPFPWAYNTAVARMDRFCLAIGVENRGFHNFRHTVITNRLAAGVPLQAVAALAGHSSTATTDKRYNHTTALSYSKYV